LSPEKGGIVNRQTLEYLRRPLFADFKPHLAPRVVYPSRFTRHPPPNNIVAQFASFFLFFGSPVFPLLVRTAPACRQTALAEQNALRRRLP
jgi:hypothetical protein